MVVPITPVLYERIPNKEGKSTKIESAASQPADSDGEGLV